MIKHYISLTLLVCIAFIHSVTAQTSYVATAPPLTGGNSQAGITFNVKAISAINIKEVYSVFASATSYSVTIWYHPTDSINGVPTVSTSNGWIALGPYSVSVSSTSTPTLIASNLNISFAAGTVHGFHIAVSSGSVTYTTGPSSSGTVFGDANMYINTGTNCGYGGSPPNSAFYIRQFNGKIGYQLAGPPCNAPTGLAASNITNNAATLNWSTVSGSLGYEYVLDQVSTNPTGAGTATSLTSYSATGLSPNTTYYMHVRNKCSTTTFSSWTTISFTTVNFISCYSPATVSVSNMTSSTATLNWSTVSGTQGYEYKVDQSSGNPTSGWSSAAATVNSVGVTGLTGGTGYYAHVRNVCQPTDKSVWVNYPFTTPTCNKPANVLMSNITDSTADVLWSQMPNANKYDYVVDFSNQDPTGGYQTSTGITTHLTGLSPNSKYYIHVRSRCFINDSSAWRLDSFITKMVCYAPSLQVNFLGTNTPYAFWAAVPTAIAYEYQLTNFATPPAFGTEIYNTFVDLTLPDDSKDYYLYVRAKCNSQFTVSQWSMVALRTGTTGISSINTNSLVNVYPNPAHDILHITGAKGGVYRITDITGKVMETGKIDAQDNAVGIQNMPAGIYMLYIENHAGTERFKITKQ